MSQRPRALSAWRLKRPAWLSLLLLVLTAWPGFAQRSVWYGFATAKTSSTGEDGAIVHGGIGGAAGFAPRWAFGFEIGGFRPPIAAMASLNLTLHLRSVSRSECIDPFVIGGLSVGHTFTAERETVPFVNLGTGTHYWFRPRLGVRTEARLYVGAVGHAELRLGIAFR